MRTSRFIVVIVFIIALLGSALHRPAKALASYNKFFFGPPVFFDITSTGFSVELTVSSVQMSTAPYEDTSVRIVLGQYPGDATYGGTWVGPGLVKLRYTGLAPGTTYYLAANVGYTYPGGSSGLNSISLGTITLPGGGSPAVPGWSRGTVFNAFQYPVISAAYAGTIGNFFWVAKNSADYYLYMENVGYKGLTPERGPQILATAKGGGLWSMTSTSNLYYYDVSSNSWSKKNGLSGTNLGFASDPSTGKLYAAQLSGVGLQLYEYDLTQWLALPNGYLAVSSGQLACDGSGRVWFFTGSRLFGYDLQASAWREAASPPFGMSNFFFVYGNNGRLYAGDGSPRFAAYDSLRNSWAMLTTTGMPVFPGPGTQLKPVALVSSSGLLSILRGRDDGQAYTEQYKISLPLASSLGTISVSSGGLGLAKEGRGYINIFWTGDPPAGASPFVEIWDGYTWRRFYTTGRSWDSRLARIFPSEETLSKTTDTTEDLFERNGQGLDLRDDPRVLYRATRGDALDNTPYYRVLVGIDNGVDVSTTQEYHIALPNQTDNAGPTVSATINSGAVYTTNPYVTINVSASDPGAGLSSISFSNDNFLWSVPQAFALSPADFSWTLPSGAGPKTVYVKVADALGNETVTSASIYLDTSTTPASLDPSANASYISSPSGSPGNVDINGVVVPTRFVNKALVKLSLSAGANTHARYSFDGMRWSSWEPVAGDKYLTLPAGERYSTVFVQYKDSKDVVSPVYWQSFTFDTQPPSVEAFWENNATVTTGGTLKLYVYADDDTSLPGSLQVSIDGGVTWQAYTSPAITVTFSTKGFQMVYLWVRDQAGNISKKLMTIFYQ